METIIYQTRQLVVLFEYTNNKICCTIYRKGTPRSDNFKELQSCKIPRPGFKNLDSRTQKTALRKVLKAMRNRQSMALSKVLVNT